MEAESEPYVRLATLRTLHRVVADLNAARSLAGTLQAVVEGAVHGLGFDAAAVSLVRPDGDLVVAAVWELEESPMGGPSVLLGQVGSRESWDRLLGVSDHWGTLRFLPYDRGWAVASDIPRWIGDGPLPVYANDWHPADGLLAPMYSAGGDLLGVLSVDRPRSGKRPGAWTREALEMFSLQASIAIGNARLRAEMQRALARLEKEQQALRASEESFRQAFEYAPSGMAITELHGAGRGQLTRVNDALCRLLGRPRAVLRQQSFADLVHPEDRALLERTSAESGRAELRLSRRDGGYQWVCLRNSIVADAAEGPSFLLTHVEDIEDR
ncbi:PAS domain S-box protein, partial [Streptomyces althioticus]